MESFNELEKRLQIAKDGYQKAVEAIDAKLHQMVRQDPKALGKAKAFQKSFVCEPDVRELVGHEQPVAPAAKAAKKK